MLSMRSRARPGARAALALAGLLTIVPAATAAHDASPAAAPRTIVVRDDLGGDTASIADAVSMAAAGDTILIHPGQYSTSVRIDKDVTLRGVGDAASVVLVVPADAAEPPDIAEGGEFGYALFLDHTDATIANLTVQGLEFGLGVVIRGGAPTLEDVHLVLRGAFRGTFTRPHTVLSLEQDTAAVLRRVDAVGWLDINTGATPTILGSRFTETCFMIVGAGTSPSFADASITGCPYGWAVEVGGGATATLLGGTVTAPSGPAIRVRDAGTTMVVRGTSITGSQNALIAERGTVVDLVSAAIHANGAGVLLHAPDATTSIRHTSITGSTGQGLTVVGGGTPVIEHSTIAGNAIGLALAGDDSAPTLVAVTICDNDRNIKLGTGVPMPDVMDSTLCPDPEAATH